MGQVYLPTLDRLTPGTDQFPMPPCTRVNPEIFVQHRFQRQAKQVCMGCPFRAACRVKIMHESTDPGGVYAALTEDERNEIRKRVACPPRD